MVFLHYMTTLAQLCRDPCVVAAETEADYGRDGSLQTVGKQRADELCLGGDDKSNERECIRSSKAQCRATKTSGAEVLTAMEHLPPKEAREQKDSRELKLCTPPHRTGREFCALSKGSRLTLRPVDAETAIRSSNCSRNGDEEHGAEYLE